MRWLVVFYLLTLGAVSLAAEKASATSAKIDAQTATSARSRAVAIEVCLSGTNDVSVPTDSKGTYRLTREHAELSAGVAREVDIGAPSTPLSETHSESCGTTARSRSYSQTIDAATIKQISKTCRSSSALMTSEELPWL